MGSEALLLMERRQSNLLFGPLENDTLSASSGEARD